MERQFQSQGRYIKISFEDGKRKLNTYLDMPSPTFEVLKREISALFFEQHKVPQCELKFYWFDEDRDEIEMFYQRDYDVFLKKRSEKPHLYVSPSEQVQQSQNGEGIFTQKNDDPASFVIHEHVECDVCGLAPIVGFRYKCIQCPNFDLCQRCEGQRKHPDHMMVRMPNEDSPNVIEAWVSSPFGRGSRRSKRERKSSVTGGCPFFDYTNTKSSTANGNVPNGDAEANVPSGGGKHHHHHDRKHHRRQMRNGFLSHMYEMMSDFAEGGATYRQMDEGVPTAPLKSDESAKADKAKAGEENNAKDAAEAACEAATLAAEVATKLANEVAAKVTEQAEEISAVITEQVTAKVVNDLFNTEAGTKTMNGDGAATTEEKQRFKDVNSGSSTSTSQNGSCNNTKSNENTSVPVTPTLEDIAQFIDPKFMKAGIQLLNNFSGMFAKMLDPMEETDEAYASSYAGSGYQARKVSTASATSSMSSTASSKIPTSTNNNMSTNNKQSTDQSKYEKNVGPINPDTTTHISAIVEEKVAENQKILERPRSQSEEHDWQMIDSQAAESTRNLIDVSATSSTESIEKIEYSGAPAATSSTPISKPTEPKSSEAKPDMSFEKLSLDLKNHLEKENQREQPNSIIDNASTAVGIKTGATPKLGIVVYHQNASINKAIHAMMAMGFSNEGGWLTQLLESVNGNISAALDLMSPAQNQSSN